MTLTGTTGVSGGSWLADVTTTGTVTPRDGSATVEWYVAADDRWHDPAVDAGVRQERIDGTAVFETRVRIPNGDAVQRVWSVPDGGGFTLVEITNDSPLPIACALTRSDLLTARPPTDVPIEGIDLPTETIVLPIGHRTSVTLALAHAKPSAGLLPGGLPSWEAVARGWVARTDRASQLELPSASAVEAVRTARCEAILDGSPDPDDDPERFLLVVGELVRMGEIDQRGAEAVMPELAVAVAATARRRNELAAAALSAASVAAAAADEPRALKDLRRLAADLPDTPLATEGWAAGDIAIVAATERRLVAGTRLVPDGIAGEWLGQNLEAHGLVAGAATRLSLALRWHGPNVAVLWEVAGDPVELSSGADPSWRSKAASGESLWQLAG